MNINCTLLFQILNFLLTYWVLSRFVFKPALERIEKNKQKKAGFEQSLIAQETALKNKHKELHTALHNFQQRAKKEFAPPKKETPFVSEIQVTYSVDNDEVEALVKEVRDKIIQEVPRVR